jgi:antitoxin CcdA
MGKQRVNLTCDAALLTAAKARGLNLSETLERSLKAELAALEAVRWRAANKEAIKAYNERIDKEGTFGEQIRGW